MRTSISSSTATCQTQACPRLPRPAPDLPRSTLIALLATVLACGEAPVSRAQPFSDVRTSAVDYSRATIVPGVSCEALARQEIQDVVQMQGETRPAQGRVPAFCRITGTLAPEIAFEVSLPLAWNGRFYMFGNGGLAGDALDDPGRAGMRDGPLSFGFAVAQTNTGHDQRKEPGATFVLSNPQKAIDYAYRGVHLTAVTAKALIERYYARPAGHSYWGACSNGGRQGLIEAQRYPEDFDGVMVEEPWIDVAGTTLAAMWNHKALTQTPLSAGKLALVARQVMARCDSIDGLKDGLIDDPRKCDFDARRDAPACPAGTDGPDCLTSAQAETVMKIYGGPRAEGRALFPGFSPGSEQPVADRPDSTPMSAWLGVLVPGTPGGSSGNFGLAQNTMRYFVHVPPEPDYDYQSFDFGRDVPMLAAWGREAGATETNLSRFRDRGGKLLIIHGWADPILQPTATVRYYEQVAARYGHHTGDFFRLFMVPGRGHCSGANGMNRYDAVTAVVNWVEKGRAPDVLPARRVWNGQTVRSRPLCPYPEVARYRGTGSIDDAQSFRCGNP